VMAAPEPAVLAGAGAEVATARRAL
jgi:hypothetical protein